MEWLAHRSGLTAKDVLAVGNDYNDMDLLKWAARSFVVNDAPGELLSLFPVVRSGDESDFSEAVALWQGEKGL